MYRAKTPTEHADDTLSVMLELAKLLIDDDDMDVHPDDAMEAACRLASLVLELDLRMRAGDGVPTAWHTTPTPRAKE